MKILKPRWKTEYRGDKLRIDEHTILILEGIHALNPELTPQIPAASKYKIYVSAPNISNATYRIIRIWQN